MNLNWIYGDQLDTHTASYIFRGQDKGRLYFFNSDLWIEFVESPKVVQQMIEACQWFSFHFIK